MANWPERWQVELNRDVARVYHQGLEPTISPRAIPALAELAEEASADKFDGSDDFYAEVVEQALHRAIAEVARSTALFRTGDKQIEEGLAKLFGIHGERRLGLGSRRDDAGPSLGYLNGDEGLRKAKRDGRRLYEVIIDELTEQLIAIAAELSVGYQRRFQPLESDLPPFELVKGMQDLKRGWRGPRIAGLSDSLLDELRELCACGLTTDDETRLSDRYFPNLRGLTERVMDLGKSSGFPRDAVETVLSWAIDRVVILGIADEQRDGFFALFGIGKYRGMSLERRLSLYPKEMRTERWNDTPTLRDALQSSVTDIVDVRDKLLELSIEVGYLGWSPYAAVAEMMAP